MMRNFVISLGCLLFIGTSLVLMNHPPSIPECVARFEPGARPVQVIHGMAVCRGREYACTMYIDNADNADCRCERVEADVPACDDSN